MLRQVSAGMFDGALEQQRQDRDGDMGVDAMGAQ
jgi:hypothetical protein